MYVKNVFFFEGSIVKYIFVRIKYCVRIVSFSRIVFYRVFVVVVLSDFKERTDFVF